MDIRIGIALLKKLETKTCVKKVALKMAFFSFFFFSYLKFLPCKALEAPTVLGQACELYQLRATKELKVQKN